MKDFPTIRRYIQYVFRFWPFIIPVLVLFPGLSSFPYPAQSSEYSDMVLTYYPKWMFLRNQLINFHVLPFWNPTILSGTPFAANPLSDFFYLPGWLSILFPFPLGFNILCVIHLVGGAIGMYLLLRMENLTHYAALLGAVVFEAMPKIFAHYGAGHLSLVYAIPWTPWLLWATQQRLAKQRNIRGHLEIVFLALIFFADVRWAFYAGCIWVVYNIAHSHSLEHEIQNKSHINIIWNILRMTLLYALLCAPLAIPLWEFTRLSSRSLMEAADVFIYSLPLSRFIGLFFPDFGGFHEWVLYPGGVIIMLCIVLIVGGKVNKSARFWLWTALFTLVFSLGSNIPGFSFLAKLPIFDLLRVPSRALFLTGIAISALSAYSLDQLWKDPQEINQRRIFLILTSVTFFSILMSIGLWFLGIKLYGNFIWGSIIISLGSILIGLRIAGWQKNIVWYVSLITLCLMDLLWVDISLIKFVHRNEVFAEDRALGDYLLKQSGLFRTYSPSYSLAQQTAANYDLQIADGVDPMQLQSYVGFMQQATGIPWKSYSVTLPPYANGNPSNDNASYQPDPYLLGLLNVRFIASEFDISIEGLKLKERFGETRLYENTRALPRAWIQPLVNTPSDGIQAVREIRWTPNKIEITAEGPGLLVLSEIHYPGWQAWVDGNKVKIQTAVGLLRSISLDPGIHLIRFQFYPFSVFLGLLISLITLVYLWFRRNC
jgi:hypothetical protein